MFEIRNDYSNDVFNNVPLTSQQIETIDFIAFESETSLIYPFAINFDDLTLADIDSIIRECNQDTSCDDFLYFGCESVLGINPILLHK